MRVLVTGGAGFIGSHVAEAFANRGDTVTVVDDLSHGQQARLSTDMALVTITGRDGKTYTYWSRDRADLIGE